MKKQLLLLLFTILLISGLFAQESITNIVVTSKIDGSGIVDVYYDLSGPESTYEISLEVSFDGGNNFAAVDNTCLTGDVGPVQPGTGKYLIWDGLCSNSETYSSQTKIKIIATNSPGGTCGDPITDIDGNSYNTVQIGTQCWMAENLNTTKDASGTSIIRYCYDNNTSNCDSYGGLYDWETMMNGEASSSTNPSGVQGICPNGWHLPSDVEWTELVDYVVSQGYPNVYDDPNGAGNALKSCRQVSSPLGGACNTTSHPRWDASGTQYGTHYGTDVYGFSALPGGFYNGASFYSNGSIDTWWSTTQYSSPFAWVRKLQYNLGYMDHFYSHKAWGYSVRCIRD